MIELSERGVRRDLGDGTIEEIAWETLERVSILTTDGGPFLEDVFFLLEGPEGTGCAVPQLHAPEGFLDRLQRLPGFDHEAVIRAMGSTDNDRFVCWELLPVPAQRVAPVIEHGPVEREDPLARHGLGRDL